MAVRLQNRVIQKTEYAIVEGSDKKELCAVVLPAKNGKQYIMVLEDVIRSGLSEIFSMFHMQVTEAFPIKIARCGVESKMAFTKSFVETISKSVKGRVRGEPVRLTYDHHISQNSCIF